MGGNPVGPLAIPLKSKSHPSTTNLAPVNPPFYPADLSFGGSPITIRNAYQRNIFLNSTCIPLVSCWGSPHQFQVDLNNNTFIHIIDQYVGANTNLRYPVLADMITYIG